MHSESLEENGVGYCASGYIPLYPLLIRHWDKPLDEMPQTLRLRVEKAVPGWNDIYRLCSIEHDSAQLTIPQTRIRLYDMQRDHTQERQTLIALDGYLHGGDVRGCFIPGQLPSRIDEANSSGSNLVAEALRDDVSLPLEKICSEVDTYWPYTEPRLWKALCKFREMTLPGLIDKAKCEKNNNLVTELGYVSTYIYRILNLERHLVDPEGEIESEWKANAAAQASPVFVKLEETNIEKSTLKQVWEADAVEHVSDSANIKANDEPPGITEGMVAITKIAINAAWQIRCEIGRKASAKEVIKKLQEWVMSKKEPDLIKIIPHGVVWMTSAPDEKPYDINACRATLKAWEKRLIKAEPRDSM